MLCRNCYTVMMETDLACPSCRSPVARATAPPPALTGSKPSGLLMALPIFGGAVGGLIYGGLTASQAGRSTGVPRSAGGTRGPSAMKRVLGVLLIIGGGLFLVLALVQFLQIWNVAHREPKAVTAADLSRSEDYVKSAPDWLQYTFAESKPTKKLVMRNRLDNGVPVLAKCLLVRVQDAWLAATVGPEFEGNKLVGRLVSLPSSLESLAEGAGNESFRLLPYELQAAGTSARERRIGYTASALVGVVSLLCLWPGLRLVRRRAPAMA